MAAQLAGHITAIFGPSSSANRSAAGRAPQPSHAVPFITGGRLKRRERGIVGSGAGRPMAVSR
ncbi:MAG: hypothetical protein ACREJJ_09575 [Candidatus Methylomirabilales bacterium]